MAKILGWTDEVTTCDCCGKTKLSGTFGVELENGEMVHYGSVCVKRNTGIKNPESSARKYEAERLKLAEIRWQNSSEYQHYYGAIHQANREGNNLQFATDPTVRAEAIEKRKAIIEPHRAAYEAKRRELLKEFKLDSGLI